MRGSCLCGGVQFDIGLPNGKVTACHCVMCRKSSGHVWAAVRVEDADFRLIHADTLRWYRSSNAAERGFCTRCGSSVLWNPENENAMHVAPGALENPTGCRTAEHIFTEDAGDYYAPEGGPFAPPVNQAVPEALTGSCLCGAHRFTAPGPAGAITACHCSRCRSTSGYHAASFDCDETGVVWQSQGDMGIHETSGHAARGFCRTCGSRLWFRAADGSFSIEAGCIDGPTGGWLAGHIFVADKGDYYDLNDGLPQSQGQ